MKEITLNIYKGIRSKTNKTKEVILYTPLTQEFMRNLMLHYKPNLRALCTVLFPNINGNLMPRPHSVRNLYDFSEEKNIYISLLSYSQVVKEREYIGHYVASLNLNNIAQHLQNLFENEDHLDALNKLMDGNVAIDDIKSPEASLALSGSLLATLSTKPNDKICFEKTNPGAHLFRMLKLLNDKKTSRASTKRVG